MANEQYRYRIQCGACGSDNTVSDRGENTDYAVYSTKMTCNHCGNTWHRTKSNVRHVNIFLPKTRRAG